MPAVRWPQTVLPLVLRYALHSQLQQAAGQMAAHGSTIVAIQVLPQHRQGIVLIWWRLSL
jgi:hypothetical protein